MSGDVEILERSCLSLVLHDFELSPCKDLASPDQGHILLQPLVGLWCEVSFDFRRKRKSKNKSLRVQR